MIAFDVIAYRGAIVFSRDGWIADVKSRGGALTRVPSGFFHDIETGRFGTTPPLVYELPPLWLLLWMVPDLAADEVLRLVDYQGLAEAADNQRQDVANIGLAVGNVAKTGDLLVKGLPIIIYVVAIAAALYIASRVYVVAKAAT